MFLSKGSFTFYLYYQTLKTNYEYEENWNIRNPVTFNCDSDSGNNGYESFITGNLPAAIITTTMVRNVRKMKTITVTIQKTIKNLSPKEQCDNENTIKDHSDKNDNGNVLICSTDAVNLKDSVLLNSTIFGDTVEPVF